MVLERDVLLQGREGGQETMDFPITRLANVEGDAQVKETLEDGDFIPVVDSGDGGQMKKLPASALVKSAGAVTSEQLGKPGGIATLGSDGKLAAGQRPDIGQEIDAAVSTHNSDADTHGDIRASIARLEAYVQGLELKYATSVKENGFTVSFETLGDVVVTGVWNTAQSRIEF